MTKEEALTELKLLEKYGDPEEAHMEADDVLVKLIDDPDITAAFTAIKKWYA